MADRTSGRSGSVAIDYKATSLRSLTTCLLSGSSADTLTVLWVFGEQVLCRRPKNQRDSSSDPAYWGYHSNKMLRKSRDIEGPEASKSLPKESSGTTATKQPQFINPAAGSRTPVIPEAFRAMQSQNVSTGA